MGNRVLTGMSGGATVSSRYRSSPALRRFWADFGRVGGDVAVTCRRQHFQ